MKASDSESKKVLWSDEEDRILLDYINLHGRGHWNSIPKVTGLKRGGKSCRLRWLNYLSPSVNHGEFSEEEEDLIIRLHNLLGNRWSLIAGRVPGRTDNQIKNHWNTHLSKKLGIKKQRRKLAVSPKQQAEPSLISSYHDVETVEATPQECSLIPPNINITGEEEHGNQPNEVEASDRELQYWPESELYESSYNTYFSQYDLIMYSVDDQLVLGSPGIGIVEFMDGLELMRELSC